VDFCSKTAARAADGLVIAPLFTGAGAVLVRPDDGGVDHRVFVVRIIGQFRPLYERIRCEA
jgi:hypothetical protein